MAAVPAREAAHLYRERTKKANYRLVASVIVKKRHFLDKNKTFKVFLLLKQ